LSSITSNLSKTLSRQLFNIIIQLGTSIIIARGLGVEILGFYALAMIIPTFLTLFLSLGITASNIYFVGQKEVSRPHIYSNTMFTALFIILLGYVLVHTFITAYGGPLFPNVPQTLLFIALMIFPFSLLNSFHLSFLQAIENFTMFNIISLFQPFIYFILIILLLLTDTLEITNIIYAGLLSHLLLSLLSTYAVYINGYHFELSELSVPYIKKMLSYGLRSHISNMITFVNYRADLFLLNLFSAVSSVGIYTIAVQIAERLWMLSQALSTVMFPRFVALQKKEQERLNLIAKAFRTTIILTSFAAVLLSLFGYYLIEFLYGHAFLDAYTVILYLIPGIIAGSGSRILANAIAAQGRPELNMYTSLFGMLLNIGLNLLLIPHYGFVGAAIATSTTYFVNTVLRIWLFNKLESSFCIITLSPKRDDIHLIYTKILATLYKRSQ